MKPRQFLTYTDNVYTGRRREQDVTFQVCNAYRYGGKSFFSLPGYRDVDNLTAALYV
jgi:hypothetical protein